MEPARRELLVARISSGSIRCRARDHRGELVSIVIRKPSRDDVYAACEVHEEVLEQSKFSLFTEDDLVEFLYARGLWDEKRQKIMEGIPKDIENLKVGLFQMPLKNKERDVAKKTLASAKSKLAELIKQRHAYDHLSCSGAANIAKSRYLIGKSLFYTSGKQCFSDEEFWEHPSTLLDNVMSWYASNRLEEADFRDLARNDPWRSIWLSKKSEESLFGVPAVDHTDEQRALLTWSIIYENAYSHSECPPDQIFEDDDMFDGWMIVQRRKRDEESKGTSAEHGLSDRVRNSQEVYLVAENTQEAKKIHELNDQSAQKILRKRFDALSKQGTVREMDMPDTKKRYRMAVAAKLAEELRNRQ